MTTVLKEIVGELSGLSGERQLVAASVIHALWAEEQASDSVHPEWQSELDRRNAQIRSGDVELADEASMETFVEELLANEG
jgi:RecB family exonuclease